MSQSIKLAEAKLKAAQIRIKAAARLAIIASYERQASNPAYDGQVEVCLNKAAMERAYYDKEMAEADLIIAQATEEK